MLRKLGQYLTNCNHAVHQCRAMSTGSFKSVYSLEKLYPQSNFDLTSAKTPAESTATASPASNSDEKFDGFIPVDKLTVKYCKSSGPGGQHVNKVNTKADVRFHVATAEWLPQHIRNKILEKKTSRINKVGELVFSSDRTRSQMTNFADCLHKIRETVAEVSRKPKEPTEEDQAVFVMRVEKANRERLRQKQIRSSIKRDRGRVEMD